MTNAKIVIKMNDFEICREHEIIGKKTRIKVNLRKDCREYLVFPLMQSEEVEPDNEGYYVFDLFDSRIYKSDTEHRIIHNLPKEFPLMVIAVKDIVDCFITVKTDYSLIKKPNKGNKVTVPPSWYRREVIYIPYKNMTAEDDVFVFDTPLLYSAKAKTNKSSAFVQVEKKYKKSMIFLAFLEEPTENKKDTKTLLEHY